jgi:hypothetical protein
VDYWKFLEIVLFIPPSTFLGVAKLHVFGKKILDILGDALTNKESQKSIIQIISLLLHPPRQLSNHPHLLQITSRSHCVCHTSSHFFSLFATYTSSHLIAPLQPPRMSSTENHVGAHSSLHRCVCSLHSSTKIVLCNLQQIGTT